MGRIVVWDACAPLGDAVRETAEVLAGGGVAVFPTDTVYGIAQSVLPNPEGPRRVFAIKHRDPAKTVAWLVGSGEDLERYGSDVPPYALRLAEEFWPGGLTLVVKATKEVPHAFRAADGTIALRMPDAPFALALCRAASSPLATTSANTSGLKSPSSFAEVEARIIEEADIAVDGGPTLRGQASTVVLCTGEHPHVIREGCISSERIWDVL